MKEELYDNNYFIEQLENGREIKVCYMVHNAYWPPLERINKRYPSVHIDISGRSIYYYKNKSADWDFIILSSSNFFSPSELISLEEVAMINSMRYHKRVTAGCLSFIPFEEREDKRIHMNLNIFSIYNQNKYQGTIPIDGEFFNEKPIDLLNMVAIKHDELEQQKIMVKR